MPAAYSVILKTIIISLCLFISANSNASQHISSFSTNQSYISNLNNKNNLDLANPNAVFAFIFSQLPKEVTVYPTENYYYYQFHHQGIPFAGNIRLDALDRDQGIAHFAYFSSYNRWSDELVNKYKTISKKDGLKIKKIAPLRYRLTYNKKSVLFNLNDLSKSQPSLNKIRPEEIYIGPVYDESGMQFYLLYNPKIKLFHYVLNDNKKIPDILTTSRISSDLLIGNRTGFAYLRDAYKNRLILIGVYEGNSMVNNYFDGPFDQLPDNFIKGNQLQKALIQQRPELKGKIDRFGNTENGLTRVLIAPYMHYEHEYQLALFTQCTSRKINNKREYYKCLSQSKPDEILTDDNNNIDNN